MLVLLFLYLGYIALAGAGEDRERAAKTSAILALAGAVNLPIIRYSVVWWNTLHQGSSITLSRSEEHTSELQSLMRISYAVFCLKKKKNPHSTAFTNKDEDHR